MKNSKIGGQAVIEGIMMRGPKKSCVAVRKADGTIVTRISGYTSLKEKLGVDKVPIVRGIISFAESLGAGMGALDYSASVWDEEENQATKGAENEKEDSENNQSAENEKEVNIDSDIEEKEKLIKEEPDIEETNNEKPEKLEKSEKPEKLEESEKPDEKVKKKNADSDKKEDILMGIVIVFSVILAIGLFVLLPFFISELLSSVIKSTMLRGLIEGIIRVLIMTGYIKAISLVEDIKRIFMYHGAEHKCINCIENGLELNLENVKKQNMVHKRCGTGFLVYVMFISILFFMFITAESSVLRMVLRIILIPVIAGIAYEIILLAGKYDNPIINIISKPGFLLQGLTTKEPDDDMIEVGIASVNAVFNWREFLETYNEPDDKKSKEKEEVSGFEVLSLDDDDDEELGEFAKLFEDED